MTIAARFYRRVNSFIVIEMRALSPAHSWLLWNCVLQRTAATFCDDGVMMVSKML